MVIKLALNKYLAKSENSNIIAKLDEENAKPIAISRPIGTNLKQNFPKIVVRK